MGGGVVAFDGVKIKGGRWTVFKFFTVSVAYTSVWLQVSSDLVKYRSLYGPQILLWLNVAYYAPSIPLLIFQSFFDEALEASLGVACTILWRLIIGLVGYGLVCAGFPFLPHDIWYLLCSVVALGLFSSIAFSASYQLVARFANKNLIALSLGCSASGPLVLLLQLGLGFTKGSPFTQHLCLYATILAIVITGLCATVSLLFRHWDAIEAAGQVVGEGEGQMGTEEALLEAAEAAQHRIFSPKSPGLIRSPSLPPLLAYNLLEPYDTYLPEDDEGWSAVVTRRRTINGSVRGRSWTPSVLGSSVDDMSRLLGEHSITLASPAPDSHPLPLACAEESGSYQSAAQCLLAAAIEDRGDGDAAWAPEKVQAGVQSVLTTPRLQQEEEEEQERGRGATGLGMLHVRVNAATGTGRGGFGGGEEEDEEEEELSGGRLLLQVLKCAWPAMVAIGLQGGIALTLFPFFTYVPSSGVFGEELPRVLFFVRIFSDIVGRMLPRLSLCRPATIWPVLAIAMAKLVAEPLFFVYLKSPPSWHEDYLVIFYVVLMWGAGGFVNTASNMVAPKMVPGHLKSTAAAFMAITYQTGHFIGLASAALLSFVMFGHSGGGAPH